MKEEKPTTFRDPIIEILHYRVPAQLLKFSAPNNEHSFYYEYHGRPFILCINWSSRPKGRDQYVSRGYIYEASGRSAYPPRLELYQRGAHYKKYDKGTALRRV